MPTSSSDLAVSVRNLSKQYTIAHNTQSHTTAGEAFVHLLKRPFRKQEKETFQALHDVTFDVCRGEVVGIVGRNGAGKSTLFKVLSRITEPTAGEIDIYGRVGSLLEVGTGFHPELTGRENIFLNGSILGMRRREIQQKFEEIVAFAEIERFLDTPVKRYSSGMYVRLAFAVAAHLEPEILIVDEVLAVGDVGFQKKCLGKMKDVAGHGRTILFVSHNMVAVQALCNRCVFLERGRVCFDGDVAEAVRHYEASVLPTSLRGRPGEYDLLQRDNRYRPGELMIQKVALHDEYGEITNALPMGRAMTVAIDLEGLTEHPNAVVDVTVNSDSDGCLIHFNTEMKPPHIRRSRQRSERALMSVPRLPLTPGRYWIDVAIENGEGAKLDHVERAANFFVVDADVYGSGQPIRRGVMFLDGEWEIVPAEADEAAQNSSSAA